MRRRAFLQAGGALVVSFAMPAHAQKLPGALARTPSLDAWLRIAAGEPITVFTGKAELGQGVKTALLQIAAEQLAVDMDAITLVTADTALTPNEGYTAGSNSMKDSGTAILHAAAQAREILIAEAAKRLQVTPDRLTVRGGEVHAPDGRRLSYGTLVDGKTFRQRAAADSKVTRERRVMGKPVRRVDIPSKVTGGASYVQDLRLPDMVHARVVRPPSYGARLQTADTDSAGKLPDVIRIVRSGSFLAVIATREWSAVRAMRALRAKAKWEEPATLPRDVYAALNAARSQDGGRPDGGVDHRRRAPLMNRSTTAPASASSV